MKASPGLRAIGIFFSGISSIWFTGICLWQVGGKLSAAEFSWGSVGVDLRGRCEWVESDPLTGKAWTGRLRLSYQTPAWEGLTVLAEGEFSRAIDDQTYDAYPGKQGRNDKASIFDPATDELNRLQVQYRQSPWTVTVGRQRIIRGEARHIGNVGWRQNEQTFDAATVEYTAKGAWSFYYGYLHRAWRIFGSRAEVGNQWRLQMDGQLAEITWRDENLGRFTTQVLLLPIGNATALSSNTWGVVWNSPEWTWNGTTQISFLGEYAYQWENRESADGNPFGLSYFHLRVTLLDGVWKWVAGWESLEGNGRRGFSTPLATLHAWNGWADQFLTTPADGLRDAYVSAGWQIRKELGWDHILHYFTQDDLGAAYGWEYDTQLRWQVRKEVALLAKYAHFSSLHQAGGPTGDVDKFWAQVEIKY